MKNKIIYNFILLLAVVGTINSSLAQGDINAMEYFIDGGDLGIGANTPVPITNGAIISESFVVPTGSLSIGFHTIYFRIQDIGGQWSISESRSFYLSASNLTTQANIVDVEYFIDTDPGYGSGTSLGAFASSSVVINQIIPTSGLAAGFHVLYTRSLDSDGVWSETESRSFYVDGFATGLLTGIEYFYNSDPGFANGNNFPISPATASINQVVDLPTTTLSAGTHELGIRMINENGVYGMTEYYSITLCDVAIADFISDVVCVGDPTLFTEQSTGILTGDVFSWDFDSDGLEDSNTTGNQSFNFATSGLFNTTLSIDRAGCISTITLPVQVEAQPVSDAGIDQTNCNSTVTLAANTPSINETGTWTIQSGTAIITDPTNPVTTLTSITSSTVELIWTLTNSLAGCSDQNNVLISSNLPISANPAAAMVDIGQTVNINVQSIASINIGDILTTTLTNTPSQGDAMILGDGTIDFTPYSDASTSDSFTFRITNQCSNFDESLVNITIVNQAPIIETASFTATINTLELNFDLTNLISDPNNNLDFSSLKVASQPISGAIASINESGILTIDYRGVSFSGIDELEIEICDLVGVCSVQLITIPGVEVGGENPPIKVFNGVSPNGDGIHDFLEIENIEFYPQNIVIIINRWGAEVARFEGYNNQDVVFNSSTLPAGTYYYHVLSGVDVVKPTTGFFLLKYEN